MHWNLRIGAIWDRLRESLWFLPAIGLGMAIAAAEIFTALDGIVDGPPWFETNAESARALLSSVATATLTLTGLVFSVTMLVLQLSSSQLSPRVMGRFLRDRHNQIVLAILIATFAYALLALRNVESGSIPSFTVWVGISLGMVSMGAFIHYIDHMAQSIRPASVVQGIGDDTRSVIEELYPDPVESIGQEDVDASSMPGLTTIIGWEDRPAGVIVDVDGERLAALSERYRVRVVLRPRIGDFLPSGAPVFDVQGDLGRDGASELLGTVVLGRERTMRRDVAFGLRQLVDIAERALSPGVNDPTTAVQALDQIHDILRIIARRRLGPAVFRTEGGVGMAIVGRPSWDDLVGLALDEIRLSGSDAIQIHRRLRFLLEDLLQVAPPHRHEPLRLQLEALELRLDEQFTARSDRLLARRSSAQGHGT